MTLDAAVTLVAQFNERRDAVSLLCLEGREEVPMEIGALSLPLANRPQRRPDTGAGNLWTRAFNDKAG